MESPWLISPAGPAHSHGKSCLEAAGHSATNQDRWMSSTISRERGSTASIDSSTVSSGALTRSACFKNIRKKDQVKTEQESTKITTQNLFPSSY